MKKEKLTLVEMKFFPGDKSGSMYDFNNQQRVLKSLKEFDLRLIKNEKNNTLNRAQRTG